ncbi:BrxA/BrxB family bacilliredoxin [Streptomyces sp. NPDC006296]|uniref:BrxA/BrxB family bacilliredoxin n=1 Tax=Streptomyces sp. NPDC006296 TaxID=3156746 RepID=UPI0033B08345
MRYSPLLVRPMKEELTEIGFTDLLTTEEVDGAMKDIGKGLTLVAVNSVSGVAAATARPGVRRALEDCSSRPDRLLTVLAEQETDATARMRSYFADIPPSEPSFALFKDGELVHFLPRHRIEERNADTVAADLRSAFEEFSR